MKRDATSSHASPASGVDDASAASEEGSGRARSLRVRAETTRVELARARSTLAELMAREGVGGTLRRVARVGLAHAEFPVRARRRARERFVFLGRELEYTFARYNNTFLNERTVEISIARWFLDPPPTGRMLEVGNVLTHYGIRGHDVLDRYETIHGVMNQDVLDFVPTRPYDTVVSVSTLEHVGQDEEPSAPDRAVAAFDHLVSLAASGGRVLVTIPIGYNAALDAALASGRVQLPIQTALKRIDAGNHWVETTVEDGLASRYGSPFDNANAIYVGMRDARAAVDSLAVLPDVPAAPEP